MAKQRNTTVGILDIGSSKIVCFIARIISGTKIEIIGIGHNIAHGIKAGRITDIKLAETAVIQAVEAAEKMANERIKKIYVSISSNNLISQRMSSDLMVTGHEISDKDINRLLFQLLDKYNDQELEVIHSFAYDYMLDGNRGIDNPLGMYGNQLTGDFHIVSTPTTHVLNINNCLSRCQLEVDSFVSSAYSSGMACLMPDEMSLGVTLIELGGGNTSISVFNRGQMLYTDALPIGGIHITNDIARGLSTDFLSAERVKTLYGTTVMTSADHDEMIEVPIASNGEDSEMNVVNRSTLVEIIRARVDEILEITAKKLELSGMAKFAGNKIVITGGGSLLGGMKELVSHNFSKTVRVGYPKQILGLAESTSGVAFSTSVGMLMHVIELENLYSYSSKTPANEYGPLGSVFNWLKENFG